MTQKLATTQEKLTESINARLAVVRMLSDSDNHAAHADSVIWALRAIVDAGRALGQSEIFRALAIFCAEEVHQAVRNSPELAEHYTEKAQTLLEEYFSI